MDRGAQLAIVHGVTKNWTRLSDYHFTSGLTSRSHSGADLRVAQLGLEECLS